MDKIHKIGVLCVMNGGLGDVAGSAKFINFLKGLNKLWTIEWFVMTGWYYRDFDVAQFLEDTDRVSIHIGQSRTRDVVTVDILVDGPAASFWGLDYIEGRFRINILNKEVYIFTEIARYGFNPGRFYQINMNLEKTTGVFIDRKVASIDLPNGYSDQKYISNLSESLQKDILKTMEYGPVSINSGYAHKSKLKNRFIWFTLLQSDKNTTVVLNRHGEFEKYNFKQFVKVTMKGLKEYGVNDLDFHTIIFYDGDQKKRKKKRLNRKGKKIAHIVSRDRFIKNDMINLQLISDRLLATGDNTACESFAARCKLYVYENMDNCGCKYRFLDQQIVVANEISTDLGRFIKLAAENKDLTKEELTKLRILLKTDGLDKATVQFCNNICGDYNLEDRLKEHFINYLETI